MNIIVFVFDLFYMRGGVFILNYEKLFRRNNIFIGYFRIFEGL